MKNFFQLKRTPRHSISSKNEYCSFKIKLINAPGKSNKFKQAQFEYFFGEITKN